MENTKDTKGVKVGFVSLGCSKNLMDTEVMMYHLVEADTPSSPRRARRT